jgi:uncharacterized surface protein with fasciclin (FAS1) repeats
VFSFYKSNTCNMKKLLLTAILAITALVGYSQTMMTKDVIDVAMASPDHTQLVGAIKGSELVATLKGRGPFTIFAPTNAAFDKLPKGAYDRLLSKDYYDSNIKILTYHILSKAMTAADIMAAIQAGGGKAEFTTFSADKLIATMDGDKVKLTDEKGKSAWITATDIQGSNGVIHTIDGVLMPQ